MQSLQLLFSLLTGSLVVIDPGQGVLLVQRHLVHLLREDLHHLGNRAADREDYGQGDKTVEQAEDTDEEEDLEEWEADVGLGGGEQDEGEEGGQAPVQHRRAHLRQGQGHALVPAKIFFQIFSKK